MREEFKGKGLGECLRAINAVSNDFVSTTAALDKKRLELLKVLPPGMDIDALVSRLKQGWEIVPPPPATLFTMTEKVHWANQARSTCHFCSRMADYQLYCRGQLMKMVLCPFCGAKIIWEKGE